MMMNTEKSLPILPKGSKGHLWPAGWEAVPWHVLIVQGGREMELRDAALARGLPAVTPMRIVWRRPHRRARGERVACPVALLPGYLFASVPPGAWPILRRLPGVRGVVTREGAPAVVRRAEMERLLRQSVGGACGSAAAHRAARGELRVGDRAEIAGTGTPMDGWTVEVSALTGERARVLARFFGSEREIEVGLDELVAA